MDSSALASSILALRSSIRTLESFSNSLEAWLYFWVTLVAIGVVLEVGFVVWEYREELGEYHRGTIRSPQKPNGRKLVFALAGALLVAVGVSGELFVDVKSGQIQTALRTKNGELVEILQGASSVALTTASQTEREAAQLIKDAEGLKKIAEDERMARLNIEASMMWRRLSKKQGDVLCSVITPKLAGALVVTTIPQDIETVRYAMDFRNALVQCGAPSIMGVTNSSFSSTEEIKFGVWIRFNPDLKSELFDPSKLGLLARAIGKALKQNGVRIAGVEIGKFWTLAIYVGPRPPPSDETDIAPANNKPKQKP